MNSEHQIGDLVLFEKYLGQIIGINKTNKLRYVVSWFHTGDCPYSGDDIDVFKDRLNRYKKAKDAT
mgnify:CR=1 FL=1